jgi:hypothetical protein
MGDSRGKYLAH